MDIRQLLFQTLLYYWVKSLWISMRADKYKPKQVFIFCTHNGVNSCLSIRSMS
jgi:hypothetical protein